MYPVIDVLKTSRNLRKIRIENHIKVSDLQLLFNMENPQAIYNWENEAIKTLPRLDHLVVLSKVYKVSMDELIVLCENAPDSKNPGERLLLESPLYSDRVFYGGISASKDVIHALEDFYGVVISIEENPSKSSFYSIAH